MKQIRPRDLRLALLVGLTAALFIWVVLVYFVEPSYHVETSPAAGLLAYAIGFFFSAFVGLYIYIFTTAQSQDRQFRQQYTTKHVEEIYAPLHDEIVKVVSELDQYRAPWLQVWPEKKTTHYGLFVDDQIAGRLNELEALLAGDLRADHSKGLEAAANAATKVFQVAYGAVFVGETDVLRSSLANDSRFLYDPKVSTLSPYTRSLVSEVLKQTIEAVAMIQGSSPGGEGGDPRLEGIIAIMKKRVESLPEVARVRAVRDKAFKLALSLRSELKDRVLRPYELR